MPSPSKIRYPELDLLRTLAIAGMVLYHGAYDLAALYGYDIPVFEGIWLLAARTIASLFLLLVGASFIVARTREEGFPWKRHLKRCCAVLLCAMLVTAATYLNDPETFVRFGILHCIGVGLVLLPLFRTLKEWNLLLGMAVIGIGLTMTGTIVETRALLPLGFMYENFRTVDYFPLLPWFGVILIGAGIGHFVYVRHGRKTVETSLPQWLSWPGKYSLWIYMFHQPALLALLMLMLGKPR